ncbi:hypothetical protein Bbelb_017980 [Branchiostoma belcheri]|nr:hypothetical protein Bbelb_017980 [Branchiostoma belcheri]
MFGAGKRKTRPPARYRDDEWEVPYQPQDVSTPRDRLRLAVQKEWRDVTREVERLQADIADMNLEGEDADNASATPLPLPRRGVVERDSRTISRELDRHLGLAQKRQQTATRDPNRPSLNEIRALNRLAGIDPVLDYMGEDFAQQTAPTLRHSAQLPTQEQFEQAPVTEDDPGKGKRKLLSGLSRKVHDKVVKEVYWPHEFVFNSLTPVTADNITWDQLISGELAIIFSPKISVIERHNRSLILRNLLLDVQVYTFPGIRSFYRTMLLHAERALFDLESTQVLTHLARLKEEYLRRPAVSTATTANKSTTSSTKGQSQASSLQFNPCFKFNAGTCSEENDHQGANGITLHHKYCHTPEKISHLPRLHIPTGDGTAHAQTTTQAYALPHINPAGTVQYTNGLELSTDAAAHSQASTTAISSQRTPTSPMDRQHCERPSLTANTAAPVPTTQFTYPDKITYANQGSSVSHAGEDTVLTRTDSPTLLQRFSFKTGLRAPMALPFQNPSVKLGERKKVKLGRALADVDSDSPLFVDALGDQGSIEFVFSGFRGYAAVALAGGQAYDRGRPAIFRRTSRNIPHDVPQSYARRSAILRTAFRNLTHGVLRYFAGRTAVFRTTSRSAPESTFAELCESYAEHLFATRAVGGERSHPAVSLGGVSTLLRPGWWAGPHLRAVIGAPERHVVCGARESTSAAAATCGYYGDVRGNARPNSVANEMYQFLMRVNKAMGRSPRGISTFEGQSEKHVGRMTNYPQTLLLISELSKARV